MLALPLTALACLAAGWFAAKTVLRTYRRYFQLPPQELLQSADLNNLRNAVLRNYYLHPVKPHSLSSPYARLPHDRDGVPLVVYERGVGPQYNPGVIALYALDCWQCYLQHDCHECLDVFLKQADWLARNHENGAWYYRFDHPSRSYLKNPWPSGFAQGLGISVTIRAWQFTSDERFLVAAKDAFRALQLLVDGGGVAHVSSCGIWFEEYPCRNSPTHVLNGHVFALFGIWDYWRVFSDPVALTLFQQGVLALRTDLHKYDEGHWMLYEQGQHAATNLLPTNYMHFVPEQLKILHRLTLDTAFWDCAVTYNRYLRSPASFFHVMQRDAPYAVRSWLRRVTRRHK